VVTKEEVFSWLSEIVNCLKTGTDTGTLRILRGIWILQEGPEPTGSRSPALAVCSIGTGQQYKIYEFFYGQ
jgi:hypothetical protein